MIRSLVAWLDAREGIAHRAQLVGAGFRATALRASVRSGEVRIIRRTWFATSRAPEDLETAARHGGTLACTSAARRRGWWIPEGVPSVLHLHRQPHARAYESDAHVHWTIPVAPVPLTSLIESVEDSLAHIATCLDRERALVLWESAARLERLSASALRAIRWRTEAARECAEAVTGLSDSGLETIFIWRLRHLGCVIRQQVVIAGRRVDVLIGERLVIQIDGFAHHSSAADRRRDLEHDAELMLRGYTVLRFGYAQILHDWPAVERTIARAIAAGAAR